MCPLCVPQIESNVYMVYNVGSEELSVSDLGVQVDDGQYHVVRATRHGANSTLQLDSRPVQTKFPRGQSTHRPVQTKLHRGQSTYRPVQTKLPRGQSTHRPVQTKLPRRSVTSVVCRYV